MTKKDILKLMDNACYYLLIAGSILVLIFEFLARLVILKLSIILYGASFLILCALCSMKLYFIKNETKENEVLVVDKSKESKTWLIIRLVLSAVLSAVMLTFLCLF